VRKPRRKTVINLVLYTLVAVLATCVVVPVLAQSTSEENLLQNPGFEDGFEQYGPFRTAVIVRGWTPWWRPQPAGSPAWKTRMPEYKAAAPYRNRIHSGHNAQQLFTAYGTHVGGIYQVVDGIEPGSTVRFAIWGHAWAGDGDNPYESEAGGPMHMAIGIDPTGGVSAFSPRVTWSEEQNPLDTWTRFEVEVAAVGSRVTVFTRSAPEYPTKHNDVYWDSAELVVTVPSPTPTSTPRVYFAPVDTPTATPAGSASQGKSSNRDLRRTVTPTQTPSPTLTALPTSDPMRAASSSSPVEAPTPVIPATGSVCVTAYKDRNANRSQDDGEPMLAGVTFVLTMARGAASEHTTNGIVEPFCFDSLELDTYYLTVTPPSGYGLSSPGSDAWEIRLGAQKAHVRVGFRTVQRVQYSTPVRASTGTSEQGTQSVSLMLWMVLLIVGGAIAGGGVLGRRKVP
jgi:hypothetical protein